MDVVCDCSSTYPTTHTLYTHTVVSLYSYRFFRHSHTSSGCLSVDLCSVFTVPFFPLARRELGVGSYSRRFGTRVSGIRLTCPAQLSCDLTLFASMLVVSACSRMRALVIRSCQWTPMIALRMCCSNCSSTFTWRR